ncbi:MAG: hypothetical protein ABJH08_10735 [Balneola sp.]
MKQLTQVFQVSESIIYRRLKKLKDWNWIGYDNITSVYHIRGFGYIYEKEELVSRTVVKIHVRDIFRLQSFSFSACVGYLAKSQGRRKGRRAEQQTRCSQQSSASFLKPIAISVLETITTLSKDTIIKLKNRSATFGYLHIESSIDELFHVKYLSPEYYKANPDHWGRIRRQGLMVGLVSPDRFYANLKYSTKRYK